MAFASIEALREPLMDEVHEVKEGPLDPLRGDLLIVQWAPTGTKSNMGPLGSAQCWRRARQDSNLRPRAPEARALSTELRALGGRSLAGSRRTPCGLAGRYGAAN